MYRCEVFPLRELLLGKEEFSSELILGKGGILQQRADTSLRHGVGFFIYFGTYKYSTSPYS
jgi:hypothetical protein